MDAVRADYEAAVRELQHEAARRFRDGQDSETIGRALVAARNSLKRHFRAQTGEADLAWMEERNLLKYGDPIGPDADWFLALWQLGSRDQRCLPPCRLEWRAKIAYLGFGASPCIFSS